MSWQAADWVDSLPYDVAKPLATRVLLKLANVAAQDGTRAYRNVWEMADELGVVPRSIKRAYRELEAAELIHAGDQRVVAHIRADRRPSVYDLNFSYEREFGRPELPMPDEASPAEPDEWNDFHGVTHGVTELSTGSHGVTHGVTTAVHLGTKRTTYLTLNEESLVPERAQAPDGIGASADQSEKDASGDSLRDAGAIAAPKGCGSGLRPHVLTPDRKYCTICGRPSAEYAASA